MAYGIFRKVATLEFLQHHFAKSGHGDGLLMTRQLISTFRQPPLHYLTRSVRRTSGFVLADYAGVIGKGYADLRDLPLAETWIGMIRKLACHSFGSRSRSLPAI